ncbi:SAV_915 family protein [Streptomyces sp. NPDC049040]|uniref:SAV_915 family protein n=1 Tax=Streptomyces sp. NPDC049040 TaxID=3365593 RepID=UPI00371720CC
MSRISELPGADVPAPAADPGPPVTLAPDTRLYIPAHPRYPADPAQPPGVGFEFLTQPRTGAPVPVAFTTLDALVAALGESQPWIAMPAEPFAELMRRNGFGRVSVDPVVASGTEPYWTPEHLRAYTEAVRR